MCHTVVAAGLTVDRNRAGSGLGRAGHRGGVGGAPGETEAAATPLGSLLPGRKSFQVLIFLRRS